ncbi:hypothetical protein K469DRAFT_712671 [Zopfia rhizophila CBS 207.26]|uniref:Uncharacterized protein n=1 Tax=Zopfia rhizophila CBS 207.26 TaxID=1314779 RepID=A0A6A6EQI6_9PEZI|nr:hypothetical protein K469DRAFT_712671 [Zopfia rhizophila CBS 207.26]
MAPGVRADMSTDDLDRSYPESSPDPLAVSLNENRVKSRRKSTRPQKEPLASSSPNKQSRKPNVSEQTVELSSPSKSMVMNTGRSGGASPWRIKVTVEAEPGSGTSDDENMKSPSVKRMMRTKTTTVPLKDADASSPVKRRGRPRKSDGPTERKTRRSGTPVRRRSKTRRSSNGATDTSAVNLYTDSAAAQPKKRRGRPRKSIQPEPEDEETLVVSSGEPKEQIQVPVIPTALADPQEMPNLRSQPNQQLPPTIKVQSEYVDYEEPISFTPKNTELSRRIRSRKGTPAAKGKVLLEETFSDEELGINTPFGTDEEAQVLESQKPIPASPADTPQKDAPSTEEQEIDVEDDVNGVTTCDFDEGPTRMPDDTTVLESENFSMVSVDSLPSSRGLSSPLNDENGISPAANRSQSNIDQSCLQVPSAASRRTRSSPQVSAKFPQMPSSAGTAPSHIPSSPPVIPRREQTPSVESRSLSNPPTIEAAQFPPQKTETPKLARVVKAGIALQGVLDPARTTPTEQSSEEALERQKGRLDDLFRGFSDGTRRELQAGLRLGEQLARQSQERELSEESSPAPSSPSRPPVSCASRDDIFYPSAKHRKSRLLTPEDQDHYVLSLPPPPTEDANVKYPSLKVSDPETQLVSPARSESEMSWQVDTPPVGPGSSGSRHLLMARDEEGDEIHGTEIVVVRDEIEQEDYSDIWQEEASRSSDLPSDEVHAAEPESERTPQLQDLFANDGSLIKPARSKIPKTWRRKSSSDFNYSDEAEEPQQEAESPGEMEEHPPKTVNKGKVKVMQPAVMEEQDEDNSSESSDDIGMFFQENLPNVFKKKGSSELKARKSEKLDLSLLMGEEDSLLPESSPIVKTPKVAQPNPFKNTPPRFAALQTSPHRSSPLRQELRASDPEESFDETVKASYLLPSSPFHTQAEDSVASDALQFCQEMEGQTDSSIRYLREEADAHANAYEPRDRTLHEIEEVTEPSQSQQSTVMASSPSQGIEDSILARKRDYSPLFGRAGPSAPKLAPHLASKRPPRPVVKPIEKPIEKPVIPITPPVEDAPKAQSTGLFSRLTSSLWSVLGTPTTPPPHPITAQFDPLPKVEPWTKTHYKTLDTLYQLCKKHPALFDPSTSGASNANNALLAHFLSQQKNNVVGAKFSSWGYNVQMNEITIMIAAVFMQLLKLKDIAEYEKVSGKKIEMGDCNPGEPGTEIDGLCVIMRLASVIMGEKLRKDEKKGRVNTREGGMVIEWPN